MTGMKRKTIYWLRILTEISFLILFMFIIRSGKYQLWLLLFALGVIFSMLFSRIFCGWVCPMNTLFRPLRSLFEKLGLKRIKTPKFMKKPAVRYLFLIIFMGIMISNLRSGMNLPVIMIITGIAIIITVVFEEALWHNRLCPLGTILNLTSNFSVKGMKIKEEKCISCGKCQIVCPTHVIETLGTGKRYIHKKDCLVCYSCQAVCPTEAIRYSHYP